MCRAGADFAKEYGLRYLSQTMPNSFCDSLHGDAHKTDCGARMGRSQGAMRTLDHCPQLRVRFVKAVGDAWELLNSLSDMSLNLPCVTYFYSKFAACPSIRSWQHGLWHMDVSANVSASHPSDAFIPESFQKFKV
jgi:hypothetical protein